MLSCASGSNSQKKRNWPNLRISTFQTEWSEKIFFADSIWQNSVTAQSFQANLGYATYGGIDCADAAISYFYLYFFSPW